MALVHAVIGMGEAIITGLVIRFVLLTRPDLIETEVETDAINDESRRNESGPTRRRSMDPDQCWPGLGVALAVAVFLSPFASELPDGLEFVGQKTRVLDGRPAGRADSRPDARLSASASQPRASEGRDGGGRAWSGTLVVFVVSWGLARVFVAANAASGKGLRGCGLSRWRTVATAVRFAPPARCPLKLLFALAFVVVVVATPIGQWRCSGSLGLLLAFLIGLLGTARSEPCSLRWAGLPRRWSVSSRS